MAATTDELYLLENIFSKVEYDETLENYVIRIGNYLPLRLTENQQSLLEDMCEKNSILLEKLPEEAYQSLSLSEVNNLFREYNQLKKEISESSNKLMMDGLQKKAISIRNQLVEYYYKTMHDYILYLIPDIYSLKDYEDIFQDGYEILIKWIDKYNPNQNTDFKRYLRSYASIHIMRKFVYDRHLKHDPNALPTVDYLQKNLRIPKSIAEPFLEEMRWESGDISLEELEEKITQSIDREETEEWDIADTSPKPPTDPFIDYTYEELIDYQTFRFPLMRLLDTLPPTQKEVLLRRYGFNGTGPMNFSQIGESLSMTKQNISKIYKEAIDSLFLPARYEALKEIVMNYTSQVYLTMNCQRPKRKGSLTEWQKELKCQAYLEETLVKSLPKEELLSIINKMNTWSRNLLIYQLELNDGPPLTDKEIMAKEKISYSTYLNYKSESLSRLIDLLRMKYSESGHGMTREEWLKYMMNYHINKPIRKRLHK